MFTGIIQKIGTVKRISRGEGLVVEIDFAPWTRPLEEGESVAVNGVCLTVAKCDATRFTADVLEETVSRTGIGDLIPGDKVNLERALRAGDMSTAVGRLPRRRRRGGTSSSRYVADEFSPRSRS